MMTAARRRAHALLHVCAATAVAVACSSDFPNEPDRAVTLEAVAWPTELHVTDVATIEIHVRFRDSPQEITGLRIRWQSSNDNVLRVVPVTPQNGGSRQDTLLAQRRAELIGLSRGVDTLRVVVDSGSGFEPTQLTSVIPVTQKWLAVSAGRAHTCGISVDSLVYCWGEGLNGKLGTGENSSLKPAAALAEGAFKFIDVSAGDESTCGVIREHVAFCWGSNSGGRLGNGDALEQSRFIPTVVNNPLFTSIDVGRTACGLANNRAAYCWGSDVDLQLGLLISQPHDTCRDNNPNGCSRTPIPVTQRPGAPTTYRRIAVGGHHVCGLSQTPDSLLAFCWGLGPSGALGDSSVTASDTAVPVSGGLKFLVLVAGGDHSCGIATSGSTYCWGANAIGQLGHGLTGNAPTPALITLGAFDSLTAGSQHTCALSSQGEASCWGRGAEGQLGNSATGAQSTPVVVSDSHHFKTLSAGAFHTCGVTADGSLFCWGRGSEGQLGTGNVANVSTPTRVVEP